jgi:hypothetical protein
MAEQWGQSPAPLHRPVPLFDLAAVQRCDQAFSCSLFLVRSFLLFNRATGFLPPQPQIDAAGAHRACQGWPLFAATVRFGLYMTEHDGRLVGLGRKAPPSV